MSERGDGCYDGTPVENLYLCGSGACLGEPSSVRLAATAPSRLNDFGTMISGIQRTLRRLSQKD